MAAILEEGPSLQEEEFSYQKKTTRNDELTKIRMPIKFGIGSAMVLLQTRDPKDGQQATRSWGISKEQPSLTALEQPAKASDMLVLAVQPAQERTDACLLFMPLSLGFVPVPAGWNTWPDSVRLWQRLLLIPLWLTSISFVSQFDIDLWSPYTHGHTSVGLQSSVAAQPPARNATILKPLLCLRTVLSPNKRMAFSWREVKCGYVWALPVWLVICVIYSR